jgi:hypothetical protein
MKEKFPDLSSISIDEKSTEASTY